MAKRYVLLVADAELSASELRELRSIIERRHPGDRVIGLEGNARAVIVKTTNEFAPLLRTPGRAAFVVGRKKLTAVLTSGAVGNLKKRASGAEANGQVHE